MTQIAEYRLWTPDGFREDEWLRVEGSEALSGNSRVILGQETFLSLDPERRAAHIGRIGVHVTPGEILDGIVPYLAALPLISLGFPAFSDGRSYSKAQLLRSRRGYQGVVRASGDVLIDQIPLMIRTGFTEFEIVNETALRRLEEGRVGGIDYRYQPTGTGAEEKGAYSWRRLKAVS